MGCLEQAFDSFSGCLQLQNFYSYRNVHQICLRRTLVYVTILLVLTLCFISLYYNKVESWSVIRRINSGVVVTPLGVSPNVESKIKLAPKPVVTNQPYLATIPKTLDQGSIVSDAKLQDYHNLWFMKDGHIYPDAAEVDQVMGRRKARLWPDEDQGDRVVQQLMYVPPGYPSPEDRNKTKLKKVLLYNYVHKWMRLETGRGSFLSLKCPVDTCEVTFNRSEADTADAVMFQDHFNEKDVPIRPSWKQVWIFYLLESPYHSQALPYKNVFNWTATYRHDSDVPALYDRFVPYGTAEMTTMGPEWNYAANKTKKVSWFVSNCGAKNHRMQYAEELSKHIEVDIYGGCGKHKCPRSDATKCFELLNKEYKFYLSFENSNCKDYITEKFFTNGLKNDIIPIVMGARKEDYERVAPRHSYIHVEDFVSPKELADYLHLLDRNDTLYNEYFLWKGTGELVNTYFWCRVCAMLHDEHPPKVYEDLDAWWRAPGTCVDGRWDNASYYKDNVTIYITSSRSGPRGIIIEDRLYLKCEFQVFLSNPTGTIHSICSRRTLTNLLVLLGLFTVVFIIYIYNLELEHPIKMDDEGFLRTVLRLELADIRKLWFVKGGYIQPERALVDPATGRRVARLWPDEDDGDRIVQQLMYVPPNYSRPEVRNKTKIKKILVYNDFHKWTPFQDGRRSFLSNKCPVDTCEITTDHGEAEMADAIVFRDRFQYYTDLPIRRSWHQVWIMYLMESPYHTQAFPYRNVFNWSATYRRDSDVVSPYGKFLAYGTTDKVQIKPRPNYAANRTKKVAWFVSNCRDKNGRMAYARQLSAFTDVDIYGQCGHHHCPRTNSNHCFELLKKDYKFYLAFENSNCKDYITEKLFVNALENNIIPVVMGARKEDYEKIAPHHSYIHVDDFASPKDLAHYLHLLDSNDTLYNEYFLWQGMGEIVKTMFWCRVCAMLHDEHPPKVYEDFNTWWKGPGICVEGRWNGEP